MTNPERALQFWSVLVFAAREQKVISFTILEQMTGMVRQGQGRILGHIYHYCKLHKPPLPLLNTLAVNQETAKPGPPSEKYADLPAEQARVFVYDWLAHGAPSIEDLEGAQAAADKTEAPSSYGDGREL